MRRTLSKAASVARARGERVPLVGGAVRDLLLGREVRDIDLALEGDAGGFASALASVLGARASRHERFGTATLELPDGLRVDVAATRRETYAHPGALPAVSPRATLAEDLGRRDFSIHAIALDVSRRPPAVVDPWEGRRDLRERRLRFLHPASPADDPTRAFRAVRYANRLGFSIPAEARRQIASAIALGAFDRVSGDRLRREMVLIFAEPHRARAVTLLLRLGLDRAIAAALARSAKGSVNRVRAAERVAGAESAGDWLCYFLAWMGHADARALREVAGRLALSGRESLALSRWPATRRRLAPGLARLAPSRRRQRAAGLSTEEILAAAALRSGADRRALMALAGGRDVALSVSGGDLVARGVEAGPAIGRALAATRAALEDGRIGPGFSEELAYALGRARGRSRERAR
jgi:tRNA nucleotidyltransferase (CCA-adding enzyme)